MKLKSILLILITIFTVLFVDVVNAETSAPSSFTVNGSDTYLIDGTEYLDYHGTINLFSKKTTDGTIIYCTQIRKEPVISGIEKYYLSNELDARYAYVIENGYPNKSITGDKDKDYFITALTIWYLSEPNDSIFKDFDFANGTYHGFENVVSKEVNKLLNGANTAVYTDPSIIINDSTDDFTLSSDKKYYVSNALGITVTGNVSDYTVSLENAPSGTVITDTNGNTKSVFSTNEKFIVKVPVSSIVNLSSEFKVNVSAKGYTNKAYLYQPESTIYQNVSVLYPEYKDLNASASLKLSLTTKVKISKVDATTGNELPGATLVVKDSKGNVIDTWVSTNEAHVIENLVPGTYTLTETIAPEGYELSTETITFEIKADGSVTEVVMENKLKDKTCIYISKQDFTTKEELPGAHLELRNEAGELVEAWVSSDTPHMIEELEPGKYYLTETIAPEGYELSDETVEFIVKEDGTVDGVIVMYNKAETVEVPSTSSFKTITSSLIGIIVIGLGSMIIYKNYKKNEEY